ncbi:MAG: M48 family metalloprotease, partial [Arenimonas sp.]
MQQNDFGNAQATGRRGGIRWWIILLFAAYAAWSWFGNSEPDPFTGKKAHYGATTDQEAQMGLEAFQEVLTQEHPLSDSDPKAIAITEIAKRLVNVASSVEADLAAENNLPSPKLAETFQWSVAVLESPQANAFCLPGGKMAVYTGLIPVTQNNDAMAVVMG